LGRKAGNNRRSERRKRRKKRTLSSPSEKGELLGEGDGSSVKAKGMIKMKGGRKREETSRSSISI